jgi:hypothetical protein
VGTPPAGNGGCSVPVASASVNGTGDASTEPVVYAADYSQAAVQPAPEGTETGTVITDPTPSGEILLAQASVPDLPALNETALTAPTDSVTAEPQAISPLNNPAALQWEGVGGMGEPLSVIDASNSIIPMTPVTSNGHPGEVFHASLTASHHSTTHSRPARTRWFAAEQDVVDLLAAAELTMTL